MRGTNLWLQLSCCPQWWIVPLDNNEGHTFPLSIYQYINIYLYIDWHKIHVQHSSFLENFW